MKKIISCLAALSALALISCAPSTSATNPETKSENEKKHYDYTVVDDSDFENMEAIQVTKIMGNGINLGNTMEATSNNAYKGTNPTEFEKAWGQPVTVKETFIAYKAAGFDCVRIPVAWTNTMDWSRGDFTISQDYMARVTDVVNMALEANLFVILNEHWDRDWWSLFSHNEELGWKVYEAIWNQVGNNFKDYPYQLIFEGGNEEHGESLNHKLVGLSPDDNCETVVVNQYYSYKNHTCGLTDERLDGIKINYNEVGTLTTDQIYTMSNRINQKFVDIIRSQGSKNEKRFLLIPGLNTDFTKTCDNRYKMPVDSTNSINKLIVSVHYYSPALYALADEPVNWGGWKEPATTWGTEEEVKAQNAEFKKMTKFTEQGYGVIIGEYAPARLKQSDGSFIRKDNDTKWISNVLDNCDAYNFCPLLWDCNGYFVKGYEYPKGSTTLTKSIYGFKPEDSDVAEIYLNRNYASEKPADSPITTN